jgi:MoaA/NifB/PqqE/SkfB family radical SAM enzyme
MPANFLDLHIVDFCQLNCKHCYLNKGNRVMPLDMLRAICADFLTAGFPLPQSTIILSGGEPMLHPNFIKACCIVRTLNGHITLSTNGLLISQYIHTFQKNDGIQVSVDGDERAHNFIRGKGSYEKALNALEMLDEHGIRHSISFTLCEENKHCVDHIINLCKETGTSTLNFNIYQPIRESDLRPIGYMEWIKLRRYVEKRTEREGIYLPEGCIAGGCIARILGLSVLPDGTYWDCSRHQKVIGKYPQSIKDVLLWDNIEEHKPVNPFETCCRNLSW